MLYIVGTVNDTKQIVVYRGFDTYSESAMTLQPDRLKEVILNNKIHVVNATIQNGNIVLKDWGKGVNSEATEWDIFTPKYKGPKYVLLATEGDTYKIVDTRGFIERFDKEKLVYSIKLDEIANCKITKSLIRRKSSIETMDVYNIQKDSEFEREIASKYTSFIAKATMLGYGDVSFEYEIENTTVRLLNYTGSSLNVIIPPFITATKSNAFYRRGIKALKLSEGLKTIGPLSFGSDIRLEGIQRVEIPYTVELVGQRAFLDNVKLFKGESELNMERFKLLDYKTVVLKQSFDREKEKNL